MAGANWFDNRSVARFVWVGVAGILLTLPVLSVMLGAEAPERTPPGTSPVLRQPSVEPSLRPVEVLDQRRGPTIAKFGDGEPIRVDAAEGPVWIKQVGACDPDPSPRCLTCHCDIENATEIMSGLNLDCTFCHGGDGDALTMEEAHVFPDGTVEYNQSVPPLDQDLEYQQFVNPTNLRVVQSTCGFCHPGEVEDVIKSMMATAAGHYAGGLYQNNVVDTKTPIYGTFAVEDLDGEVPVEQGAVKSLDDLILFTGGDPTQVSTHFAAVPSQACARCHLWSRGKGYRGAENADGVYRADGCAACHFVYDNDGRSQSADLLIDHDEQGHPMFHAVTREIPTEQCVHCHHRGARIGLTFTGRAQMPPRLPSGPGVPGTTDVKFNSNYHYADAETNPQDIHGERGLNCIDCHVRSEIMGDGNLYGHMDQATKIECRTCHGLPDAFPTLVDNDGLPLPNVELNGGEVMLTSKVTGAEHTVPLAMDVVASNSNAACAMNDNHLKSQGGLECYACHTSWVANCYGCHFERDETQMGLNFMTGEMEVGKVSTNNKVFETMRPFSLGPNSEGRVAPYLVACQPIADVTAADGSKLLDFVMPVTANGLSGLALNPVQPHSVRGVGEVRSCAECHRSPPSLGFGSGQYTLIRDRVYTAGVTGVTLHDFKADPSEPPPDGELAASSIVHAIASMPNVVHGTADFIYVAQGADGVAIYDRRPEGGVEPVETIEGVNAIDVSRVARYLYVVDSGVGVRIYDNDDPAAAKLVATVPIPTGIRAVPWGIHLFVAAGAEGLVIVDIASHTTPFIARVVPDMEAVDVRLYAHYQGGSDFAARAYVADPGYGVRIVDLLPDYETAELIGGLPLVGASGLDAYTRYVLATGTEPSREHDYLYVAAGAAGLHVYDITEPDQIVPVAQVTGLGGLVADVDVASHMVPPGTDDYAFLANATLGLQVVAVNDPHNPVALGSVQKSPPASRVLVEVQQMDRFLDEQGKQLKENSHPFTDTFTREDIVTILSASIACGEDCPADVDGDGAVGPADLMAVIMDWGTDGSGNGGDTNGDGVVDVSDLIAILEGWGSC